MGDVLKIIRDLTIIIAIYLYFIAWVYVHFYYQQFGISSSDVNIDLNSYLMYSYNVVTSSLFIKNIEALFFIIFLLLILYIITKVAIKKYYQTPKTLKIKETAFAYIHQYQKLFAWLLFFAVSAIVFKPLFQISRQVAIDNYQQDRSNTHNLKTIQFIFRKDADILSPAVVLDSIPLLPNNFSSDIKTIKNDQQQLLRFLGESNDYYIVLQQRPAINNVVPSGSVYFIDKKDVLLAKIILRSF